ncbi:hypothetical protein HDV05_005508 [Chytridiales sp. JEL 0842]|nr:hypothetical protein HDV05_005508 [Chytridiales sp. JEL 0842]
MSSISATNSFWQPTVGMSWNWQLTGAVDYSVPALVYSSSTVDCEFDPLKVKAMGKYSICYVNVGALEVNNDNGVDTKKFPPSVLGKEYPGWPEKFLDIRSTIVRSLMTDRFKAAKAAGCNAIEPDNTDSYTYNTGFGLTEKDQLDYLTFLADTAHSLGMSIGLKNNGDLLQKYPQLFDSHDFSVVEACYKWKNCHQYTPFIQRGKPVFAMEYTDKGNTGGCSAIGSYEAPQACQHFNSLNIEGYVQNCHLTAGQYNPCQTYDAQGRRDPGPNVPKLASPMAPIKTTTSAAPAYVAPIQTAQAAAPVVPTGKYVAPPSTTQAAAPVVPTGNYVAPSSTTRAAAPAVQSPPAYVAPPAANNYIPPPPSTIRAAAPVVPTANYVVPPSTTRAAAPTSNLSTDEDCDDSEPTTRAAAPTSNLSEDEDCEDDEEEYVPTTRAAAPTYASRPTATAAAPVVGGKTLAVSGAERTVGGFAGLVGLIAGVLVLVV